jgi:hypothetical protein
LIFTTKMARNIAPQDVTWFLDLQQRGRLDLSPPYQRRSVWTPKERRFFLDTVFNGYPCPPLFLYKSISDEGVATYHVVDGKQRLETIINFASNKIALSDDMIDDRLAGKKWKTIDVDQRKRFWNYQLAVEMLDTVDNATVKEIFDRYNRTSKNLQPQELRHAKYDGWFATAAEEEVKKKEWKDLGIVTTALARRMRDVQFASELMMVLLRREVSGFDQEVLDEVYANYDAPLEYDPAFSEEDFFSEFERVKAIILGIDSFGGAVRQYGKSYTNFYTLWSVVALNADRLPEIAALAARYVDFMNLVNDALKAEESEPIVGGEAGEALRAARAYALNARGASTELPQRLQRYESLLAAVLEPAASEP